MSNKDLKTRTAFSNAIDKDLHLEFKALSKESKIPLSKLLDEAVEDLLAKYKRPVK